MSDNLYILYIMFQEILEIIYSGNYIPGTEPPLIDLAWGDETDIRHY